MRNGIMRQNSFHHSSHLFAMPIFKSLGRLSFFPCNVVQAYTGKGEDILEEFFLVYKYSKNQRWGSKKWLNQKN